MAIKYSTRSIENLLEVFKVKTFEQRVADAMVSLPYLSEAGATVLISMYVAIEAWGGKPILRNVTVETENSSITRLELHIDGDIDSGVQDDVNHFANVIRSILVVR